jgi:4'-phosphopantetheinyl transferase
MDQAHALVLLLDGAAVGEAALATSRSWLGPDEQARLKRFVRQQRLRQFLLGRLLARMALGRMLAMAPHEIVLDDVPGRAPRMVPPASGQRVPFFSISHSGDWIACAASATSALGLDIEVMDAGRDIAALARQAFDDAACARLQATPLPTRVPLFYRMWSEHEARFKLAHPIAAAAPSCVALPHPILSIMLCSALPLAVVPRLEPVILG